jgi:glycolate oxidase
MTSQVRLTEADKRALRSLVGDEAVVDRAAGLRVYECDGYTLERSVPELVLLPRTTSEVSAVVAYCYAHSIPFVPRGAGTGVSGGCLPVDIPVMIGTSRMKAIRSIDVANRRIEVEAGVVNLEVSRQVARHSLYYAPDPSSQPACTIGGNIAENSGGPHTLKYGVTLNHLLELEMVLPDGEVVRLDRSSRALGYDLAGLCTGAEGTFGIATAAVLRLMVAPQARLTMLAVFSGVLEASRAVSAIIAAGIVPAALEMMDHLIIEAVEAAYRFGFPKDAGAVLIIELDGLEAGLEDLSARVVTACTAHGASEVRRAADEAERELLWKSRKRAFGAMGRLAPSYCTQDGVVPRSRLPEIVERIAAIAKQRRLRVANLMHAGDGNIHPIILYDDRDADEIARVVAAGDEILRACVEMGGALTGEHGIGVEKIGLMPAAFGPEELEAMRDVREVFNAANLCNPHKILPTDRQCVEVSRPRPRGGG